MSEMYEKGEVIEGKDQSIKSVKSVKSTQARESAETRLNNKVNRVENLWVKLEMHSMQQIFIRNRT